MTQTGAVLGTPYYMSPEHAKGVRELDPRTDVYSAAVILYEALSGRVPHTAQTFNELILKIVLEDPNPLDPPGSPAEAAFHELVKKGMARKPDDRFQSAREFMEALDAWASTYDIAPVSSLMRTTRSGGKTQTRGTHQAWAKTAMGETNTVPAGMPKPGSSSRWLLIAGAAVLLAGGALAWQISSSSRAEEATQVRALAEQERKLETERQGEAQKEREAAEQARQAAVAEREQAAELLKEATAMAETAKAETALAESEQAAAKAAPVPAKKPTSKSSSKPAESKPTAGAPKSGSTTSTTSTGRTIRTTF
jgi:eukaryotic-like serine/threonine-protein kinase